MKRMLTTLLPAIALAVVFAGCATPPTAAEIQAREDARAAIIARARAIAAHEAVDRAQETLQQLRDAHNAVAPKSDTVATATRKISEKAAKAEAEARALAKESREAEKALAEARKRVVAAEKTAAETASTVPGSDAAASAAREVADARARVAAAETKASWARERAETATRAAAEARAEATAAESRAAELSGQTGAAARKVAEASRAVADALRAAQEADAEAQAAEARAVQSAALVEQERLAREMGKASPAPAVPPTVAPVPAPVPEAGMPDAPVIHSVNTAVPTIEGAQFVVMDPVFAASLVVSSVRESSTKDGYRRVEVTAKNMTQDSLRAMYLFNWYDVAGTERVDPSHAAWEKITVLAGDDVTLSAIAPRKDCTSWKLRFRAISPR